MAIEVNITGNIDIIITNYCTGEDIDGETEKDILSKLNKGELLLSLFSNQIITLDGHPLYSIEVDNNHIEYNYD